MNKLSESNLSDRGFVLERHKFYRAQSEIEDSVRTPQLTLLNDLTCRETRLHNADRLDRIRQYSALCSIKRFGMEET